MNAVEKTLQSLVAVPYKDITVVSAVAIAAAHGLSDSSTVRHDFKNNKEHFIEGVDYFLLSAGEAKAAGFSHVSAKTGVKYPAFKYSSSGLVLFTQSGYLMLCKALTDETAWAVYKTLVSTFVSRKTGVKKSDLLNSLESR